jgi:hypothetical protein
MAPVSDPIEPSHSMLVAYNGFTVDDAGAAAQSRYRFDMSENRSVRALPSRL